MRLDRLATLYLAQPLGAGRRSAVPILMYHSVTEDRQPGIHPYYRTTVSPQVFAEQMAYLHREGYRTRSPGELVEALGSGACLEAAAGKAVVITFDDGFLDFHRHAAPVMQQFGFRATVYLPTSFIGDSRLRFKGQDCLTWSEVRELQQAGFDFGSHTVTHPQLHDLSWPAIENELKQSKSTIEQKIGRTSNSFAYPFAFPESDREFKRRLRATLAEAGYESGVCTSIGRAEKGSDALFLKRLPVNSDDDPGLFAAKLKGAYDWMAGPQYWVKWAKQIRAKS